MRPRSSFGHRLRKAWRSACDPCVSYRGRSRPAIAFLRDEIRGRPAADGKKSRLGDPAPFGGPRPRRVRRERADPGACKPSSCTADAGDAADPTDLLNDLLTTISFFLKPDAPSRVQLELAGPDRLTMAEIIAQYRSWHGWLPARSFTISSWLAGIFYRLGDLAGVLGCVRPYGEMRGARSREAPLETQKPGQPSRASSRNHWRRR